MSFVLCRKRNDERGVVVTNSMLVGILVMILLSVYEDMFVLYGGVDQLPNGACPGQYRKDHTQDLLEALPKAVGL